MKKNFVSIFLFFAAFLLIACGDSTTESKLVVQDITYDGVGITWKEITNAEEYIIQIDEDESHSLTSNHFAYDADGKTFTVTLIAKVKKFFGLSTKEQKVVKTFNILGTVTNLKYYSQTSSFRWDKVSGADSYDIVINNETAINVKNTSFEFNTPGTTNIKVQAKGNNNNYYSQFSEVYEMSLLAAPTNVKYINETGFIEWRGVTGSSSYTVLIDGQPLESETEIKSTKVAFEPQERDFTLEVIANGDESKNVFSSVASSSEKYIFLDTINTIEIKNGVVEWEEVENATGYEVRISEGGVVSQPYTVETNSYSNIKPGISYTVQVRAVSNAGTFFSKLSSKETFTVLATPQLSWVNNQVLWTSATGSVDTGYTAEVTKDGTPLVAGHTIAKDSPFFEHAFNEVGKYEVRIKANGDGNYYDSKFSDPLVFHRLPAVTSATVTDNPLSDSPLTVSLKSIMNSNGFVVTADNVEIAKTDNNNTIFNLTFNQESQHNGLTMKVKIRSLGKKISDLEYSLDSLTTHDLDLTKLAAPVIEVSQNKVKWDNIAGNNGYVIFLNGTNGTKIEIPQGATEYLLNIAAPGKHTVAVRAKGDGSTVISSSNYAALELTKLETPGNIRISNENLQWNTVTNSTSYDIYIGNEKIANTGSNAYLLTDKASTSSQIVRVRAIGNGNVILDSELTENNFNFYRLEAPKNLTIDQDNITYNEVTNASGYNIQTGTGNTINTNGQSYAHGTYITEAGTYQLRVQAVGNNTNIFTSVYSDPTQVVKLNAPTVRVSADGKSLEWDSVSATAEGYKVEIGTSTVNLLKNELSHAPAITSATNGSIYISAIGNNGLVIGSNKTEFKYSASSLTVPTFSKEIINRSLNVEISNKDNYSAFGGLIKYEYIMAGNIIDTVSEDTFSFTDIKNGVTIFNVRASGKFFSGISADNVHNFYLSSDLSTNLSLNFLNPVNPNEVSVNGELVSWKSTNQSGVSSYKAEITFNLKDGSSVTENFENLIVPSFSFKQGSETFNSYTIKITVVGNQNSSFNSIEMIYESSN